MGTDAALALGLAHVIVEEGLHDAPFVKEQTDLPFLVRDDDDRFLRQSDVDPDGPDGSGERFYVWDAATGTLALAPGTWGAPLMTLELDGLDPALEGAHEVTLADGSTVTVRPVFERLRTRLADYPPERVAEITGVHAENVRTVARELAAALGDDLRLLGGVQALPLRPVPAGHGLPGGPDRQHGRQARVGDQGLHLVADARLRDHGRGR